MTDLARQVNSAELANPMKLLTGNFDLSYVFIFLFPLLIVALYYNLFSSEKEKGTLQLLESQSTKISLVIFSKGLLRLKIIASLTIIILTLGFIIQGVSISKNVDLFLVGSE